MGSVVGRIRGKPEQQPEVQPQKAGSISNDCEVPERDPYRAAAVEPRGGRTAGLQSNLRPAQPSPMADPSPTQIEALAMLETEMPGLEGISRYTTSISMTSEGVQLVITRGGADGQLPRSSAFLLTGEEGHRYVKCDRGRVEYYPGIILSELERLDAAAGSTHPKVGL
jgi:hypothetical protein